MKNDIKNDKRIKLLFDMIDKTNIINKKEFKENMKTNWDKETLYYIKNSKLNKNKKIEMDNFKQLKRFTHKNKNKNQYLNNIIKGWLVEDFINILFNKYVKFELKNKDKDREFIFKNMFDLFELDGEINIDNKKINVDIVSDFTGYCMQRNSLTLNFNKRSKIIKNKGLIIILDIINYKIWIINPNGLEYKRKIVEGIKNGFKEEIKLNKNHCYDLEYLNNKNNLIKAINEAIN